MSDLLKKAINFHQENRLDDAKKNYKKIIEDQPNNFEALNFLGILSCQVNDFSDGLTYLNRAIVLKPNQAGLHCNKGNALFSLNYFKKAIESYNKAILLKPKLTDAYFNKGNALEKINNLKEAVKNYDRAIKLNSNLVGAYINKGNALKNLKKIDSAIDNYKKAILIRSDLKSINWNLSIVYLLDGQLEKGWQYYEYRWLKTDFTSKKKNFKQPLWLGNFSIKNKKILIHSEQGLGDTIQFCRYIELLSNLGANIIFEVEKPLIKLMTSLKVNFKIVSKNDKLPEFDCHCPLLSLPLAFKTNINNIPSATPYLYANFEAVKYWGNKINKKKYNIGICWNGSSFSNDEERSILLKEFSNISNLKNINLFSLQKNDGLDQITKNLTKMNIQNFSENLDKKGAFLDSAAIIKNLNLVITIDTSIAHLAGALDCNVWVILKYIPDWRWMLDRNDSPWYKKMKLFRQSKSNDWSEPIKKIESELKCILEKKF